MQILSYRRLRRFLRSFIGPPHLFICLLLLCLPQASRAVELREAVRDKILAGERVGFNPNDPASARSIDAAWIREAAVKHLQVNILYAVIRGPLDLRSMLVDGEFELDNCTFEERADFYYATFNRIFRVVGTTFNRGVRFQGTTFNYIASLGWNTFSGDATFQDMHALGRFDIQSSKFTSGTIVNFDAARFDRRADFYSVHFGGITSFSDAQFSGLAFFEGSQFDQDTSFGRVHFSGLADFGSPEVKKESNAVFGRKVNFGGTVFDSSAMFEAVTFAGDADFSNIRVAGDILFVGATFLGETRFDGGHIGGSASFQAAKPLSAARFRKDADFRFLKIAGSVDFSGGREFVKGAVFEKKALFSAAEIRGPSHFQGVEFKSLAEFIDTKFESDAYFIGTTFTGEAEFNRAQFTGMALFVPRPGVPSTPFSQEAHFIRNASFVGAQFVSEARFGGVRFDEKADFSGAHFSALANFAQEAEKDQRHKSAGTTFMEVTFDHAHFDADAHFDDAVFRGPASFRATSFHAVYFSPTGKVGESQQFLNDIDLVGCTYDRVQTRGDSLLRYPNGQSRVHPYDRQPFIELESAMKKSGADDQSDAVYLESRRLEYKDLKGPARMIDWLFWRGADYGTSLRPEFVVLALIVTVGIPVFLWPGAVKARNGKYVGNENACGLPEAVVKDAKDNYYYFIFAQLKRWCQMILQSVFLAFYLFLPLELPCKPRWEPASWWATSYANFLHILGWIIVPLSITVLYGLLHRVP
jgi:hypothetical protein